MNPSSSTGVAIARLAFTTVSIIMLIQIIWLSPDEIQPFFLTIAIIAGGKLIWFVECQKSFEKPIIPLIFVFVSIIIFSICMLGLILVTNDVFNNFQIILARLAMFMCYPFIIFDIICVFEAWFQ